jgi:hypothetical protein
VHGVDEFGGANLQYSNYRMEKAKENLACAMIGLEAYLKQE